MPAETVHPAQCSPLERIDRPTEHCDAKRRVLFVALRHLLVGARPCLLSLSTLLRQTKGSRAHQTKEEGRFEDTGSDLATTVVVLESIRIVVPRMFPAGVLRKSSTKSMEAYSTGHP